ncbi:MXAN_6640 family putative metalloprotease [Nocardioides sp.]|uniref:MXAN_6640 family putative metalloprotease n=1 Tax=Nocardioides sp. TaxID=35761 RepID=UPI0037843407
MRRPLVATALAVVAALAVGTVGPASSPVGATTVPRTPTGAQQALATVRSLLADDPTTARRSAGARPEATLAMRDLFLALPRLDAADRRTAHGLLARPTDGASDPLDDGYTVPAHRTCEGHVCVHWVDRTADAPPGRAWVNRTLRTMNAVWRHEVGELGYREPRSDGRRGGNADLDVYLKELGSRGIYGYCTPERRVTGYKWLASGYCVLDDDFARSQFGAPPRQSLRVTAAHEFFHAVQFGYDFAEDPWLLESTATWMEERVADDVDDNRQYLPYGQVGTPGRSLDRFDQQGFAQYGNWAFFEYLSSHFGPGVVKAIWTRAGAYRGAGHQYSTNAVQGVLARHGGFTGVYRAFAAANTTTSSSYPEGGGWPTAPVSAGWTLSRNTRSAHRSVTIDHLASRNVLVQPAGTLRDRRWRLRVAVDGPAGRTAPAAAVVSRTASGLTRTAVPLDAEGRGSVLVGFGARQVSWAKVVLVNASTRFACWHRTTWSCQGRARDDGRTFDLTVTAVPPRG